MAAFVGISFSHSSKLDETASILVDNDEAQFDYVTGTPGVAASSSIVSTSAKQVARVAVQGADVWVRVGAEAAEGDGFLCLAGSVEYFALNVGSIISIFEPV